MIRLLIDRWRTRRCPHARREGIYGDPINWCGGYRLRCADCGRLLDGPVSLATDPPDGPERLRGLLVTADTPPWGISEALFRGAPIYWVPEEQSLRHGPHATIPDTWKQVGFTRDAAETHAAWMRDTLSHLSLSRHWAPPAALGVPRAESWPPAPPAPTVKPSRLADEAVKGVTAAPEAPEGVRPAFQPDWTRPDWQEQAYAESEAVRIHIDTLLRNTFSVMDDETLARAARKVLP